MAKKVIQAQMQQRRDTAAQWAASNPVLLEGELGIVTDDPNLYKIGDGVTAWNNLKFRGFDGTLVQTTGDSENAVMSQKVVTEKLTELESEIGTSESMKYTKDILVNDGFIDSNGAIVSYNIYGYSDKVKVFKGQKIVAKANQSASVLVVALYDSNDNFIRGLSGQANVLSTIETIVEENESYMRMSHVLSFADDFSVEVSGVGILDSLSILEDKVEELNTITSEIFQEIECYEQQSAIVEIDRIEAGKYLNLTWGKLEDNEYLNVNIYNVSEYVGGTISIPFAYANSASYTGCLFKDANGTILEKYLYSEASTFIVPQGAETFWFTANANVSETDILIDFSKRIPINEVIKKLEKQQLTQQTYIASYEAETELLEENQVLSINSAPDIKNNYVLSFYCDLNEMGRIRIVHGDMDYARGNIEIDDTNVYLYDNALGTTIMHTIAHNLTIDKSLFVQIVEKSTYKHCLIRLSTEGTEYVEIDNAFWNGSESTTYVKSIRGNYQNAKLSLGGAAWNSRTWIFTDSYGDSWPKYVFELGFKNFLLDGVAGRQSKQAYISLERELLMGTPSNIVWCLGMNDRDTNEINQDYKETFDKLKNLCESKGINLIVTTIPNTPIIRNIYKNEYIRNSGVRYIDIASAVGADEDGSSWRSGLISSDNVHPSELGARVIASVMMTNIPSIMSL